MPVYEFVCDDCRGHFERLVPNLPAADSATCTACASRNVRRLVSSFAMVGGMDDPMTSLQSGGGCCGGSCGCGHS